MNFNDIVGYYLIALGERSDDAIKEIKKLKRTNALQWIVIGYLAYKVNENKSDNGSVVDKIDEKMHEKCKNIFKKKR